MRLALRDLLDPRERWGPLANRVKQGLWELAEVLVLLVLVVVWALLEPRVPQA